MKERLVNIVKKEWKKTRENFPANVSDFNREIEDCMSYFFKDKKTEHKKDSVYKVHGSKVTVGTKDSKGKSYFLERDVLYVPNLPPLQEIFYISNGNIVKIRRSYMDGKIIGSSSGEIVSRKELEEVIGLLHNITLPYKEHVKTRNNKH
jgi:hypothetical protein